MVLSRTGDSLVRVEDVHLLRGETTFVGDASPDAVVAHFVTSSIAHAEIVSIDTADAAAARGVLAVVTDAFVQSLKLGFEEILTMSRIIFGGSRERSQI